MKNRFTHFLLGILCILVLIFSISRFYAPKQDPRQVFSSGILSKSFFDDAYKAVPKQSHVRVLSVLSAHHLLIANKIAELFDRIGSRQVRTVVLLSPNHFDQGKTSAQITTGNWQTPYGILSTDDAAVKKLVASVGLSIEPKTFMKEHGIRALTPFVKRSFPNARLVPIVLHDALSTEKADALGVAIAKELPNAVVIASADISHYLPEYAATYHDEVTLNALESDGCNGCELEVDANSVLRVLFSSNRARGSETWNLTDHDSSLGLGVGSQPKENTSHILGYFTKGKPKNEPFAAIHVIGDVMLDRDVRTKITAYGEAYPWENMHRFLSGSNLVVGNLEGTIGTMTSDHASVAPYRFIFDPKSVEAMKPYVDLVSLANNHSGDRLADGETETRDALRQLNLPWFGSYHNSDMRVDRVVGNRQIAFVAYHAFAPNEEGLKKEIHDAKEVGKFVIVYPHWGTEYDPLPDEQQKHLAELMSDAGADLIIGGHPHVAQGFDQIGKTPIAWSLGNFVFDQPMSDTWMAMTLGVILKQNSVELYLLPVNTKNGQPTVVSDHDAKTFFSSLAARSAPDFQEQIKQGHLIFSR
ncbi:MAG: AmmeMemoRadiSam system protein B [Candidatus Uhrbacteria bacterium]|nr:AmmeMemoRadiSam system protein B [Candidatus Uhrbacteria bacterium]